jgi:hypothetical protein
VIELGIDWFGAGSGSGSISGFTEGVEPRRELHVRGGVKLAVYAFMQKSGSEVMKSLGYVSMRRRNLGKFRSGQVKI